MDFEETRWERNQRLVGERLDEARRASVRENWPPEMRRDVLETIERGGVTVLESLVIRHHYKDGFIGRGIHNNDYPLAGCECTAGVR